MSDYSSFSKEDLIKKLTAMENLLQAIKVEKNSEELLNFPWIGNLGNWYWSVGDNIVVCNDQKILALGYSQEEIPEKVGFEFFTNKLHPDDFERVMDNMRNHLHGKSPAYETTYRIQTREGEWKWFYDRGKVTRRNDEGKPELVVGIVFDVTEPYRMEELLSKQNEQLLELSRTDSLTQVSNRRALFELLEFEKNRSERYKRHFCVLMIDIDHFKKVNDTFGHQTGDIVLVKVAEIIRKIIRKVDIIGRYGGEEFIVALTETNLPGALVVAEKIRKAIQDTTFADNLRVTVSLGVAVFQPGSSIVELISEADIHLYAAKKNGRNRVEYQV
jgi:diguanylate cyclase (GGDEF)-like protein/PAS domain S-box-containing protein